MKPQEEIDEHMQSNIEKIISILIVGILFAVFVEGIIGNKSIASEFAIHIAVAAETPGEDNEISPERGRLVLEGSEKRDFIEKKWRLLKDMLRWDIYEIIIGTLFSLIGLAAIALALFRRIPNDLSLISFGIYCFLNGARTNVFKFFFDATPVFWDYWQSTITYTIPLFAFLFVEQILGKGLKSSIRLLIYASILFAIAAVTIGVVLNEPFAAMPGNSILAIVGIVVILVNLFRPSVEMTRELKVLRAGAFILVALALHANLLNLNIIKLPFNQDLEPLGFIIFIVCLGYIAVRRFFENEKELATIAHELDTARQIQSFILPQRSIEIKGLELAARYVPMTSVAGDFYDFAIIDEKRVGILVADVSGHGVPASLIASMVKIAFASQLPHASNPARVLTGINQVLCGKLESDFVTAGYLFIDTEKQMTLYADAGHPPLMVWRMAKQEILEYREKGIVLGQFEEADYVNIHLDLLSGDRLFLYTDGIIETMSSNGIRFGWDRFKAHI